MGAARRCSCPAGDQRVETWVEQARAALMHRLSLLATCPHAPLLPLQSTSGKTSLGENIRHARHLNALHAIPPATVSQPATPQPHHPAVAALSSTLSTAALDKNPQSRARGITLDLGFSSFACPLPRHLAHLPFDRLQFTLVDCPGHASLIRTIIGGARIIDMMVLVIDITKGE